MRNDSAPAAQKALTNIGRTNKEMIGLELRTIPTPIVDAGTFDAMLARFRGNIDKTLHKTVRIPGMPSTSEIRSLYEPGQRQTNRPTANFSIPQPFTSLTHGALQTAAALRLGILQGPRVRQ